MNLGERFGEGNGAGTLIDVRLTHQDLANMIASTREAVSKVMSEFQRDGLIESRNRRVVIVNGEALAEHASRYDGPEHRRTGRDLGSTLRPFLGLQGSARSEIALVVSGRRSSGNFVARGRILILVWSTHLR